jgi:hypothetical protein
MSGILLATIGAAEADDPDPVSSAIFIQGGSSGVSVTTPSGSTTAIPGGGERFFLCVASGGTPPYSYTWQRQNLVNKTALESSTTDRAYVSWTGMIVGDYQSTTANCKVRDATGASATSDTHVIGITRTS